MTDLTQLQREREDEETRRWVATWKLSLDGLRGWKQVQDGEDGEAWLGRVDGQPIAVIWSIAREDDGQPWLHVSLSHKSRIPVWPEVAEVKRLFIGKDRYAAQVHPPESVYVNLNPHVLHLWSPLERWPFPEFSALTDTGRTV